MLTPGCVVTRESIRRGSDPVTGVALTQLTSTPAIHMNIYYEVAYMDPTSRYLVLTRGRDLYGPVEVWRADLERDWLTPVADGVLDMAGMAVSPDQRTFVCCRSTNPGLEVILTDLQTLEQDCRHFPEALTPTSLGTLGPDGRSYYAAVVLGLKRFGVQRLDLVSGAVSVIHEGPEIFNAHPQVEPGRGEDLLIQHNRGVEFDEAGNWTKLVGEQGATLYLIDRDGGNLRELPVGTPHTRPVQGHQCWIGDTGEILLTVVGGSVDAMRDEGMLLALRPGDASARTVAREQLFGHASASLDGRYFVSDAYGTAQLHVGSLATGRTRLLCDTGASFGSPQYTHPHPYFSPDRRTVVFNSDRTGVPHVHTARVPEGFLEELDT